MLEKKDIKTKKKKMGTLCINSPTSGKVNKSIWAYAANNYFTGNKTMITLNINFRQDERSLMNMFMGVLYDDDYIRNNSYFNSRNIAVTYGYKNNNDCVRKYIKIFINIDPNEVSIEDFFNEIDSKLKKSITTFKTKMRSEDLDEFKSNIVAELI